MRRGLMVVAVCGLVLSAVAVGATFVWLKVAYNAATDTSSETIVFIERGAGTAAIALDLKQAGVIDSAHVFRYGVRLFGGTKPLRAGEYRIPTGASPAAVADILQSGEPVVHKITIAEGLTSAEVVSLLAAEPTLIGDAALPPEGTLLPETYHFHRNDTCWPSGIR